MASDRCAAGCCFIGGSPFPTGECGMLSDRESERWDRLGSGGTGDKFLVFSMVRCGSTTLRRLLNCHPQIRCLEEPFNPFNYEGRYLRQATDAVALNETLQGIWRTHNGIKHTWSPDGWPFVDNPTWNVELLLKPNQKVIFLRRRNLLRRLVSAHISSQTGVWGLFDSGDRRRVESFSFMPMDIDSVKAQLRTDNYMTYYYRKYLIDSGAEFTDLFYEDLYGPLITSNCQIDMLNKIFTFLGKDSIANETTLSGLKGLLDPREMKLNSIETYKRIPGIEIVERECGSDETGWVFGR
jgi:hypothetical protein